VKGPEIGIFCECKVPLCFALQGNSVGVGDTNYKGNFEKLFTGKARLTGLEYFAKHRTKRTCF